MLVSDENPLQDLPAIPLDITELRKREEARRMDLSFCNLTFRSDEGTFSFPGNACDQAKGP